MCDAADAAAASNTDVSQAAHEITAWMEEDEGAEGAEGAAAAAQSGLDYLWSAPPTIGDLDDGEETASTRAYLTERNCLVGEVDSSILLERDETEDCWPANLPKGDRATAKEMLWVDELSCIGCTWCADVARSTFRMAEPYGTARVVQQGGDSADVVEEAIACCPADCIMSCTRDELELLEEHRSHGYIDDLLARFHFGGRLTSEGEGGKCGSIPHWKDPITHQGWRKGDKYVQSRRRSMADPLLHHSGEATRMSLIGTSKVNEAPSPIMQDGSVIPRAHEGAHDEEGGGEEGE